MMNLGKSSSLLVFLCFLLTPEVVANVEDTLSPTSDSDTLSPSFKPSSDIVTDSTATNTSMTTPTSSPAPFISQSQDQNMTSASSDTCIDDPNWEFVHKYVAGWAKETEIRKCDNDDVECCHKGNHGYARDFCCKCKPADYECTQDPDDDGFPITLQILTCVGFVFSMLLFFKMFRERELHQIRQTMAARRQQQRENNEQGMAEEERNHAIYELFASRFHFQEVFPDKSNISVHGLRRSSMKLGGDDIANDEEAKTEIVDGDESVIENSRHSSIDLRELRVLSSFWRSAAKDECCICLDCYNVGETICAPITTECNHVFHEGCIHEWIKRGNDKCPLCRVELLKE